MKKPQGNNRMREIRREKGLTQYQLARILGMASNSVISRYERGRKRPSLAMAQRIALAFGVRVDDIFLL